MYTHIYICIYINNNVKRGLEFEKKQGMSGTLEHLQKEDEIKEVVIIL